MLVEDAMVGEVVSCASETSLHEIATLMWNRDCGCILVIDTEERPVGIVTDRDIAMAAALTHKPLWEIRAGDVTADRELFCCGLQDTVQDALQQMEQHEVRRLPVTNQYGQLTGILTLGDIVSFTRAAQSRSKKAANNQIDAADIMGFLKHVSGHHSPRQAMM